MDYFKLNCNNYDLCDDLSYMNIIFILKNIFLFLILILCSIIFLLLPFCIFLFLFIRQKLKNNVS